MGTVLLPQLIWMIVKYILFHKAVFYLMELFPHSLECNNTCWASQLLVFGVGSTITFEFFNSSSGSINIEGFEVVMYNYTQSATGIHMAILKIDNAPIHIIRINHMSRDHLIRECDTFSPITTFLHLH